MKRIFLRWILLALSVFCASLITSVIGLGFKVDVKSVGDALNLLVGVVVLSFLNATLGKLLKFLTMPLSCLTLGAFSLVVNGCVLWLAASLNLGFKITGTGFQAFLAALVASVLISFINGALGMFLPDDDLEA